MKSEIPQALLLATSGKHFRVKNTPLNNTPLLRYAGVYLFFLFLLHYIDCGHSLVRLEVVLTCTHNLCSEQNYEKYQKFPMKFSKNSLYIAWASFVTSLFCG